MKPLRFAVLAIGMAVGLAARSPIVHSQSWTPSAADIAKLEAGIKLTTLPGWDASLPPLNGYARYYAFPSMTDGSLILGELVALEPTYKPGVHIVESELDFPGIYDGGCSVINLVYSRTEQKILSIKCNGFG